MFKTSIHTSYNLHFNKLQLTIFGVDRTPGSSADQIRGSGTSGTVPEAGKKRITKPPPTVALKKAVCDPVSVRFRYLLI